MPRGVRGLVVLMAPHYRRGSQIKEAARLSRPDGAILWVQRKGLTTPHPSARSTGEGVVPTEDGDEHTEGARDGHDPRNVPRCAQRRVRQTNDAAVLHAKGVVLLGKFVPSAEAASVSKALHFKHEVAVAARFLGQLGLGQDRGCRSAGRPAWPGHQVSSSRRQ
jgi:hypothetical protein